MNLVIALVILALETLVVVFATQRVTVPVGVAAVVLAIAAAYRPRWPWRALSAVLAAGGVVMLAVAARGLETLMMAVLAAQAIQLGCLAVLVVPGRERAHLHAPVRGANTVFVTAALVPAYAAFVPGLTSMPAVTGLIGAGIVIASLLLLDLVRRWIHRQRPGGASALWGRAAVILIGASVALTISAFVAQPLVHQGEGAYMRAMDIFYLHTPWGREIMARRVRALRHPGAGSEMGIDDQLKKGDHIAQLHVVVHDAQPPAPMYVKTAAFDTYAGGRWTNRSGSHTLLLDRQDGVRDGRISLNPRPSRVVTYTVYTRCLENGLLPYVPNLAALHLPAVVRRPNDTFACPPGRRPSRFSYLATSDVHSWKEAVARGLPVDDAGKAVATLESGLLADRVRALAAEAAGGATEPWEVVAAAVSYLRSHCTYTLKAENSEGRDPVENFLFDERRGPCQVFATSLVLILRAHGVPCRLAVGYCGGEYDTQSRMYTFYTDDAHAWVEIPVRGAGWVAVDATPVASAAPHFVERSGPIDLSGFRGLASFMGDDFDGPDPAQRQAGRYTVPVVFGVSAMIVGAVIALLVGRNRNRRELAAAAGLRKGESAPSFFRMLCRLYARAGCTHRRGQTPREYLAELRRRGLAEPECEEIVTYLYAVCYDRQPRSPLVEERYKQWIRHRARSPETLDNLGSR